MKKGIRNANAVACKLESVLIRVNNDRLEIAREEWQKREEIMERRKAEAIVTKWRRARGRISLSNEKEDENDIEDDIDPD